MRPAIKKKKSELRAKMFKAARSKPLHADYDLHAYVGILRNSFWIGDHVDSLTAQKIASRAYDAVSVYDSGRHGKPRFRCEGWMSALTMNTEDAKERDIIVRGGILNHARPCQAGGGCQDSSHGPQF